MGQLSNVFWKAETLDSKDEEKRTLDPGQEKRTLEGFYEELPIAKKVAVNNSVSISVRKCPDTAKSLLYMETDLLGDVVVHWGVCRDDAKNWELPASPYPPDTVIFKAKALRTLLQVEMLLSLKNDLVYLVLSRNNTFAVVVFCPFYKPSY